MDKTKTVKSTKKIQLKKKKVVIAKTSTPKHKKIHHNAISGITKPAIKRLSIVAKCQKLNSGVYEEVRSVMQKEIDKFLEPAVNAAVHAKRVTVNMSDLDFATSSHGIKFYGSEDKYVQCKDKSKLGTNKTDKFVVIAKQPFERLIREMSLKYGKEMRFAEMFIENFQYFIEIRMIKILTHAYNITTKVAKRPTLFPVEIQVAYEGLSEH